MTPSLTRCLQALRYEADPQSHIHSIERFLDGRGFSGFLFYDPARPLSHGTIIRNFDRCLIAHFDRRHVWRFDPLRLQTRNRPLVWNAKNAQFESEEAQELVWDSMEAAGFRHGIAIPMHGPLGHCEVFAAFAKEADHYRRGADRLVDEFVVIAYHLANSLHRAGADGRAAPELSSRQIDCLRWTCRGKTAWEVAAILDIAERTVNFHLRNAMDKLQVRSKHQAALKALQAGIFKLD